MCWKWENYHGRFSRKMNWWLQASNPRLRSHKPSTTIPIPPPLLKPVSNTFIKDDLLVRDILHSTNEAVLLLTQQPWVQFPKKFSGIIWCRWDLLRALLRVKWTQAWKCQSNPSSTGKWQATITKEKKDDILAYFHSAKPFSPPPGPCEFNLVFCIVSKKPVWNPV